MRDACLEEDGERGVQLDARDDVGGCGEQSKRTALHPAVVVVVVVVVVASIGRSTAEPLHHIDVFQTPGPPAATCRRSQR